MSLPTHSRILGSENTTYSMKLFCSGICGKKKKKGKKHKLKVKYFFYYFILFSYDHSICFFLEFLYFCHLGSWRFYYKDLQAALVLFISVCSSQVVPTVVHWSVWSVLTPYISFAIFLSQQPFLPAQVNKFLWEEAPGLLVCLKLLVWYYHTA